MLYSLDSNSNENQIDSGQQVAIYTFDDQVHLVANFSDDIEYLEEKIDSIYGSFSRGNSTNLYGAIEQGCNSGTAALAESNGGHAIVFTDGKHDSDNRQPADIASVTDNKDIYIITLGEQTSEDLAALSVTVNGIKLEQLDDLDSQIEQIQKMVVKQTLGLYRIYYATPKRSGWHELSIALKDNPACPVAASTCLAEYVDSFSADGFENVMPDVKLQVTGAKSVDEYLVAVTPPQAVQVKAKLRWVNVAADFEFSLVDQVGGVTLQTPQVGQAIIELAADFQSSRFQALEKNTGLKTYVEIHIDTDADGEPDNRDEDDDNDGILDVDDVFPRTLDDLDNDGVSNALDTDDDGDGIVDAEDAFPTVLNDDDNDGVTNNDDAFAYDSSEWLDTDNDGIGNHADTDDDNDGILDADDPFPLANIGEWVSIAAGSFIMGSHEGDFDEQLVHAVSVPAFNLMSHEVTWAMFQPCIDAGVCQDYDWLDRDEGWGKDQRPVINVSTQDVQTYIGWLNKLTGQQFRLPSEAEWEYAARAGSATKYSWGDVVEDNNANCYIDCEDEYEFTAPVKSFAPNAFGLYDMHGNVQEWVQDCWHWDYEGAPNDGSAWLANDAGDCSLRALRGELGTTDRTTCVRLIVRRITPTSVVP